MTGADLTGTFEAGSMNPVFPISTSVGRTVPASRLQFDVARWPLDYEDQDLEQGFEVPAMRTVFGVKDMDT